jgi:hypothetical protein
MHITRALVATLAAAMAFAFGAPAARAQNATGPCGTSSVIDIGETAGTGYQVCMGVSGGSNIAPSVGQVAYIAGPVVTGANVGSVIVSAGAVVLSG